MLQVHDHWEVPCKYVIKWRLCLRKDFALYQRANLFLYEELLVKRKSNSFRFEGFSFEGTLCIFTLFRPDTRFGVLCKQCRPSSDATKCGI